MWGSATLRSPAARFNLANPYNAACVRGPAAELTPQEIRENAVLRGSRSEEAARFIDIGSEKTARGRFPAAWVWEPVDSTRFPDERQLAELDGRVWEPVDSTRFPDQMVRDAKNDKFGSRSI